MAKRIESFPGHKSFKKDLETTKVEIPDRECIRAIEWCEERAYVLEDVPMMLAEYAQERDQAFIKDIIQVKNLAKEIMLALLSNSEKYKDYKVVNFRERLIKEAHEIAKKFLRHNHQTF